MSLPRGINESITVFIPKASAGADENENAVTVRPLETRPLALKNEDNKAVAGVTNQAISPVVQACASKIQRGFVNDRVLVQNVVDLDFASRAGALRYGGSKHGYDFDSDLSIRRDGCIGRLPVLTLYDFASAFPSVAHAWLFAVLVCIRVPKGALNVFEALYKDCDAYWCGGGVEYWLFKIISGVLQGCPLSGSLFVIAIDPLLFMFERHVMSPTYGLVATCADDIRSFLEGFSICPSG